jgi:hypothetical protein
MRCGVAVKPHLLFYDCCAPERELAPSPQVIGIDFTSFASVSAALKGRRFVHCLALETL